jgi:nicotinamide riboside kinase
MLRIAICGSHSTGKTTLLHGIATALTQRGVECVIASEPIRALESRLTGTTLTDRYLLLVTEHLRRLDRQPGDVLLLDRSLIDLRVYLEHESRQIPTVSELVDELLRWYVERIDGWLYLPIEFPLVPDPRRPPSEDYRRRIDIGLRELATDLGVDFVPIEGPPDRRVTLALKAIERLMAR